MRESPIVPTLRALDTTGDVDNVVVLPDRMSERLADVLAAAGGPGSPTELRGELAARTAFQAAVDSWPNPKRHLLRTPAVVAVTTVATMLVATTGLAAASVLPGPAGRAVDGILGSVGVDIGSPAPASPSSGQELASTPSSSHDAVGAVGIHHVGCSVGGTAVAGNSANQPRTTSCVLTAPRAPADHGDAATSQATAARPVAVPVAVAKPTRTPAPSNGGRRSGTGPSTTPTTLPGGGTSRGGNLGGGTCKGGAAGGTTAPGPAGTDPTTTTTEPAVATVAACGHHGGHHGSGSTTTTTTTTPAATS